jgi:hypothetical protein
VDRGQKVLEAGQSFIRKDAVSAGLNLRRSSRPVVAISNPQLRFLGARGGSSLMETII